jgi:hypothetical protein
MNQTAGNRLALRVRDTTCQVTKSRLEGLLRDYKSQFKDERGRARPSESVLRMLKLRMVIIKRLLKAGEVMTYQIRALRTVDVTNAFRAVFRAAKHKHIDIAFA